MSFGLEFCYILLLYIKCLKKYNIVVLKYVFRTNLYLLQIQKVFKFKFFVFRYYLRVYCKLNYTLAIQNQLPFILNHCNAYY